MNIYIKPKNEAMLRARKGSMSGLVNQLLEEHFMKEGGKTVVGDTLRGPTFNQEYPTTPDDVTYEEFEG